MESAREPLTEAGRARLDLKIYRLQATIQREYEGCELDIEMERLRDCKTGRAQARDVRQQLARSFGRI